MSKKPVAVKPEKKIRIVKESRNLRYNFTAVKSQFKSELDALQEAAE